MNRHSRSAGFSIAELAVASTLFLAMVLVVAMLAQTGSEAQDLGRRISRMTEMAQEVTDRVRLEMLSSVKVFSDDVEGDANLAVAYWGMGEVSRRNEDCATAIPNLQRAVELDRKFPEAQLALGDCFTQLHRFDEAVTALNPGLNWGPKGRPR